MICQTFRMKIMSMKMSEATVKQDILFVSLSCDLESQPTAMNN